MSLLGNIRVGLGYVGKIGDVCITQRDCPGHNCVNGYCAETPAKRGLQPGRLVRPGMGGAPMLSVVNVGLGDDPSAVDVNLPQGSPCDNLHWCGDGLSCQNGTCQPYQWTNGPKQEAEGCGNSVVDPSVWCAQGLHCDATSFTCVKDITQSTPAAEGWPCNDLTPCQAGLQCGPEGLCDPIGPVNPTQNNNTQTQQNQNTNSTNNTQTQTTTTQAQDQGMSTGEKVAIGIAIAVAAGGGYLAFRSYQQKHPQMRAVR